MTKSTPEKPTLQPSHPLQPLPPPHTFAPRGEDGTGLLSSNGISQAKNRFSRYLIQNLARGGLDVKLKVNFHFTIFVPLLFKSNAPLLHVIILKPESKSS